MNKGGYLCRLEQWRYAVLQRLVKVRPALIERTTQQMRAECRKRRDPDYCPRCTPLYGSCRCEIASCE